MPVWDDGDERLLPTWLEAKHPQKAMVSQWYPLQDDGPCEMVFALLWYRCVPEVRQLYVFTPRYRLYGPPLYGESRSMPYPRRAMPYPRLVRADDDAEVQALDLPMRGWWLVWDEMEGYSLASQALIEAEGPLRRRPPRGIRGWYWVEEVRHG